MSRVAYEAAVWSWERHLRVGGTTPWVRWLDRPHPAGPPPPADWVAPGAAQLEVVRRAAALAGPPALTAFAEIVLTRSGPGRGLAPQPLVWPRDREETGERSVGAPPVDPADVPVEELVRVTVGALTGLLLADAGGAPCLEPGRLTAPRPGLGRHSRQRAGRRGPAFRLEGPPVTTAALRELLAAAGVRENRGAPDRVIVLADPLDVALGRVWSGRVQGGAAVRWPGFVRRWAGRGAPPPAADAVALARDWSGRLGAERVHVLVDPGTAEQAAGRVAALLGPAGSRGGRGRGLPGAHLWDLSPVAVDVLRRVNAVLAVRVPAPEVRIHAQRLSPWLAQLPGQLTAQLPGQLTGPCRAERLVEGPLALPPATRGPVAALAAAQAAGLTDDARTGVYRVHGDPRSLVPPDRGGRSRPRRGDVLAVAQETALRLAERPDERARAAAPRHEEHDEER